MWSWLHDRLEARGPVDVGAVERDPFRDRIEDAEQRTRVQRDADARSPPPVRAQASRTSPIACCSRTANSAAWLGSSNTRKRPSPCVFTCTGRCSSASRMRLAAAQEHLREIGRVLLGHPREAADVGEEQAHEVALRRGRRLCRGACETRAVVPLLAGSGRRRAARRGRCSRSDRRCASSCVRSPPCRPRVRREPGSLHRQHQRLRRQFAARAGTPCPGSGSPRARTARRRRGRPLRLQGRRGWRARARARSVPSTRRRQSARWCRCNRSARTAARPASASRRPASPRGTGCRRRTPPAHSRSDGPSRAIVSRSAAGHARLEARGKAGVARSGRSIMCPENAMTCGAGRTSSNARAASEPISSKLPAHRRDVAEPVAGQAMRLRIAGARLVDAAEKQQRLAGGRVLPVIVGGTRRRQRLLREVPRKRRIAVEHRHRRRVDGRIGSAAERKGALVVRDGALRAARARLRSSGRAMRRSVPWRCDRPGSTPRRPAGCCRALSRSISASHCFRFADRAHARGGQRAEIADFGRRRGFGHRIASEIERLRIEAGVQRLANRGCRVAQRT